KKYMYGSVSTTLITIISIESVSMYSDLHPNGRVEPMRLAAQFVTGLGYLGAGEILKDGLKVKGLTSVAMVFFVGAIGIIMRAGFYGQVIFTVIVTTIFSIMGNY